MMGNVAPLHACGGEPAGALHVVPQREALPINMGAELVGGRIPSAHRISLGPGDDQDDDDHRPGEPSTESSSELGSETDCDERVHVGLPPFPKAGALHVRMRLLRRYPAVGLADAEMSEPVGIPCTYAGQRSSRNPIRTASPRFVSASSLLDQVR